MSDVPDGAVKMAEAFEGFSETPYRDPVGVFTIGYGSTRDVLGQPVTVNTPIVSRAVAEGMMRRDLTVALRTVQGDVMVALTDEEKSALIDFIFNVGSGAFGGSTLLRLLNAGDFAGAADQFERWDHAGGKVLAGLTRRRMAEKAEFLKGQTP